MRLFQNYLIVKAAEMNNKYFKEVEMKLEDSNGKISEPKAVSEITDMIDRLGKDVNHCILSDGDLFIQTAGEGPELIVQYGGPSGHYEAASAVPAETVKEMFTAFFQNDPSWRTKVVFTSVEGGPSSGEVASRGGIPGGVANRNASAGSQGRGLKDDLINSVKGEVRYGLSGVIRRIVRSIFRNFR